MRTQLKIHKLLTIVTVLVIGTLELNAQDSQPSSAPVDSDAPAKDSWIVNSENVEHRDLDLELQEGTWLNLDVSPDGKEILFDLLGDIYSLPLAGGDAECGHG